MGVMVRIRSIVGNSFEGGKEKARFYLSSLACNTPRRRAISLPKLNHIYTDINILNGHGNHASLNDVSMYIWTVGRRDTKLIAIPPEPFLLGDIK